MTENIEMLSFDHPVTVTVYDENDSDSREWPPSVLTEAIAWFEAKLQLVPEEYRSTATVIFEGGSWYDSPFAKIRIQYDRHPTEAEIESRKQEARQRAENDLARARRAAEMAEQRAKELE